MKRMLVGCLMIGFFRGIDGQSSSEPSELISIAKSAVRAAVAGHNYAPKSFGEPSPVFVTIERQDKLLGCRGSLTPQGRSLSQSVAKAAIDAAIHDPRYRPLRDRDLDGFLVTVTVVERLESIETVDGLSPDQGLVLNCGDKVGVVLPWEGKNPRTRLDWAFKKAGVPVGSACSLRRMIAKRFRG